MSGRIGGRLHPQTQTDEISPAPSRRVSYSEFKRDTRDDLAELRRVGLLARIDKYHRLIRTVVRADPGPRRSPRLG